MAIGVAVDILGCTGSVDERASTLNRIILVALELKDAVGDLFAFTALMKALDLPQVTDTQTEILFLQNKHVSSITCQKCFLPIIISLLSVICLIFACVILSAWTHATADVKNWMV